MAYDRFLIAPINTGLQKDLPQWLLPEDAFPFLQNAYIWRGRIKKRYGSVYMNQSSGQSVTDQFNTRLKIAVATYPTLSGQVPTKSGNLGQAFSIGTVLFTVNNNTPGPQALLSTSGGASGTFDVSTGNFSFSIVVPNGTPIYWYPAFPVMGFQNYDFGMIDNQPAYAWDTTFVYTFSGGQWGLAPNSPTWHGNNSQFFWTTNYNTISPQAGAINTLTSVVMFASNFNSTVGVNPPLTDDPIFIFNPNSATQWLPYYAYFQPSGAAVMTNTNQVPNTFPKGTPYVESALIILQWKNRLLFLNTIENNGTLPYNTSINTQYAQRCRFSAIASPYTTNAWYGPNQIDAAGNAGIGGSYIDASTQEQIIGAEFIKDQLIVYFERSTWLLRYTQNQEFPFTWERINSELGSESTYSTVGFDREVLAIGNTGVHSCNSGNVVRIDNKIPDDTFQIADTNNGIMRVYGIRDFLPELVYWTLQTDDFGPYPDMTLRPYPTQVLVYNYRNGSWAYNDDSITAFGYFEQADGLTWALNNNSWQSSNNPWNSGITQAESRQVMAGNQQGFTFLIDYTQSTNAPVLSITDIQLNTPTANLITITCIDHNLGNGDWVGIYAGPGITLNQINNQVLAINLSRNSFVINDPGHTGFTYKGGGVLKLVSRIDIYSKQLNPYNVAGKEAGHNVYLAKIDFAVEKTPNGQLTIDYFPSSTEISMLQDAAGTGALFGTGILETSPYATVPLEAAQNLLWHPIYFQTEGDSIQVRMYLADSQMSNFSITDSPLEIQGLIFYTQRTTHWIR